MYYLGIDLGGMSIKAGVCDDNGNILFHYPYIAPVHHRSDSCKHLGKEKGKVKPITTLNT